MDGALYEINIQTKQNNPIKASREKKINRSKYVRFNKKQKEYLLHVYNIFPSPKNHYIEITSKLTEIGFSGQLITNQKIYAWFKNQRYQSNHKKSKKKKKKKI